MSLDLIYRGDHLAQDLSYLVSAPIGAIMIWSGTENNVPEGWSICNGQNGTVDLRDKFVLAAGESHNVGETGGSEEVTLTVAQMPSHSHGVISAINENSTSLYKVKLERSTDNYKESLTETTGSSKPHPNMPPYYTLLYIQKTGVTPSDYATVEQVEEIVEEKLGDSSTEEVYSTQETKIGTWIDGKPLYRRVFEFTSPDHSPAGNFVCDISDTNFDICVNIYGYVLSENGDCYPFGWDTTTLNTNTNTIAINHVSVRASKLANKIAMNVQGSSYVDRPCVAIMEYTKTTD